MSILKDIQEGNAANKLAKNIHVAKVGLDAATGGHGGDTEHNGFRAKLNANSMGSSEKHAQSQMAASAKRAGRHELKNPTPKERFHAHYDKSSGNYHIKDRHTDKIVAHNVANSGGAALAHADNWNKKSMKEEVQIDEISINTVHDYRKKALQDITDRDGKVKPNRIAGIKAASKRETAHMVKTKGPQSFPDASDGRSLELPKKPVQKSSVERVVKSSMREQIEALLEKEGDPYKKRGRPRKPRHEDGKIVNEDA